MRLNVLDQLPFVTSRVVEARVLLSLYNFIYYPVGSTPYTHCIWRANKVHYAAVIERNG